MRGAFVDGTGGTDRDAKGTPLDRSTESKRPFKRRMPRGRGKDPPRYAGAFGWLLTRPTYTPDFFRLREGLRRNELCSSQ